MQMIFLPKQSTYIDCCQYCDFTEDKGQTPMRMESNESQKGWVKRYVIGVLVVLVVYLVLLLYYIYPHWPIDLVGWFILILVGIPISLCLEWIGESILVRKLGKKYRIKSFQLKGLYFRSQFSQVSQEFLLYSGSYLDLLFARILPKTAWNRVFTFPVSVASPSPRTPSHR